jgi:hypothetical protein
VQVKNSTVLRRRVVGPDGTKVCIEIDSADYDIRAVRQLLIAMGKAAEEREWLTTCRYALVPAIKRKFMSNENPMSKWVPLDVFLADALYWRTQVFISSECAGVCREIVSHWNTLCRFTRSFEPELI